MAVMLAPAARTLMLRCTRLPFCGGANPQRTILWPSPGRSLRHDMFFVVKNRNIDQALTDSGVDIKKVVRFEMLLRSPSTACAVRRQRHLHANVLVSIA